MRGICVAGRVTYVIDGDTVIVRMDGGERVHVRLIGIDTPRSPTGAVRVSASARVPRA